MPTAAVMNRRVHKIFNLLFAFLLIFVSATACAATPEKFGTRAEFVQIQERVKVLEQELANQKRTLDLNLEMNNKRLEMGDKRLADFGALATMQSSHTTWVGIGITVIVAIAGFLTFLNATGRAQGEARHWIERNSKELKERIRELELEANTARAAIAFHADSAKKSIDADAKKVRDAAKEVMATDAGSETSLRDRTPGTTELVQEASKELQAKPERDFTASEHYVRGVSSYSEGNLQNALASFESAIRKAGNSPPAELAEYLFGRAFLLGTLGKIEEEIAGYNEIVQRFGADTTPGVREQVTRGMNNKGFRLGQQGKADEEIAVYNEIDQRFGADTTPGVREQVARGMNNKGVRLGQQGKIDEEIAVYNEIDQRFGADTTPGVREQVVRGMTNKAITLGQQGKADEEIAVYNEIVQRFGADTTPGVREQVALAMNSNQSGTNKAILDKA